MPAFLTNQKTFYDYVPPSDDIELDYITDIVPGDLYFDQTTNLLYMCFVGWNDPQVWERILYEYEVKNLFIQNQGDWSQTDNTQPNYIKNKPAIPAAQVQSDWTQNNAASPSYIQNKPTIPAAQIQSNWTQSNTSALDFIRNKPVIPAAQIQSDWNQTNTAALDYIKNKPAIVSRIQSSPVRSLNTAFQISATRDCFASYSIDIQTTLTFSGGQSGTVIFEIASDSNFTTNVQEVAQSSNVNTGTLVADITINQTSTVNFTRFVPAGYYVRLRTVNSVGTPTFTYRTGQEVLM